MARAIWKKHPIEWFEAMLSPCLEHREKGVDEAFTQGNNLKIAISEAMCYDRGDIVDLVSKAGCGTSRPNLPWQAF